jgi:hypothetical protein
MERWLVAALHARSFRRTARPRAGQTAGSVPAACQLSFVVLSGKGHPPGPGLSSMSNVSKPASLREWPNESIAASDVSDTEPLHPSRRADSAEIVPGDAMIAPGGGCG